MFKRINKKAVFLKIICGAMLGGVINFYTDKVYFTSNASLMGCGVMFGLFTSLSSIPVSIKKIIYGIVVGISSGILLFLLNLLLGGGKSDSIAYLMLPMYGLFMSLGIGLSDKSSSKILAGSIGTIIASFISSWVIAIVTVLTVGFGWARPFPQLGDWPIFIAYMFAGSLMLLGIGVGEILKNDTKI